MRDSRGHIDLETSDPSSSGLTLNSFCRDQIEDELDYSVDRLMAGTALLDDGLTVDESGLELEQVVTAIQKQLQVGATTTARELSSEVNQVRAALSAWEQSKGGIAWR